MKLDPTQTRRDYWLLMLLALLVLGSGLGLRDPWPADEPRFALVAKQMWESGQWLIPFRGEDPYPDKPPLFMWLQLACYALFRSWRVAFLLPSLLASIGTLALVYDLGRRLWSRRAAWWGTLLLLFCIQFTYQAKRAQIDPTLVFWVTLSMYGFLRHLLLGPAWGWYLIGGLFAGIGVITKGVGLISVLVLLPYLWARWRGWNGLAEQPRGGWRWALVIPAMLAPILAWLLPLWRATYGSSDPQLIGYANNLLFKQTVKRATDPWHHIKPPWYFLGVMLTWVPLNLTWPWVIPGWVRRLCRRADARIGLPLAWALLVVALFSLSPGKREVYILPTLPMFALASMPMLAALVRRREPNWMGFVIALGLSVALLIGGLAAVFGEPGYETKQEALRWLDPDSDEVWWLLSVAGGIGLLGALWARPRRGLIGLCAALLPLWLLVLGWWGYPLLNGSQSATSVMIKAREVAGEQTVIGLAGWREQMLLQAQGPIRIWGFRTVEQAQMGPAFAWLREDPDHHALFLTKNLTRDCVDRDSATRLGESGRVTWYLARASDLKADCPALESEATAE
ncbi:MAG: glycosyltransferase family 39 protein [Xanthomonadales bacterium]|nr:glycosyltransferase family 39 protein [Xanthomonadales bacterium]